MHDANTVYIIEEAFCEWQVMDCIQDICLTYPVVANNAVDPGSKLQVGLAVILEIGQGEFFKIHFTVRGSGYEVWGFENINSCKVTKKNLLKKGLLYKSENQYLNFALLYFPFFYQLFQNYFKSTTFAELFF